MDNLREFFVCDCRDRDHIIIAHKDFFKWQGTDKVDMEVCLEMVVKKSDKEVYNYKSYKIMNKLRGIWWRLREAFSILVKGYYKIEDYWVPLRMEKEKGLVGVSETKRMGETLIKFANDAEKFYRKMGKFKREK